MAVFASSFASDTGGAVIDASASVWVPPTWDEVVREHSARVYRLAYRLSGNQQDAEDLTQETFVRVFRSLADYTPGTFEGWLHRITTNLFLDMVRRRQRIRFDALPPDFRAAVVLCDIEGLSYEEIAATLGIKLGTVRSRIHRGRVLLREALAHRAPRSARVGTEEATPAAEGGAA